MLVFGLAVVDVALGPARAVAATFVLGPFLAGLRCSSRRTAVVGAVAVGAALASGAWNANAGEIDQSVRVLAVVLGSCFAVVGARARERAQAGRRRLEILAHAAAGIDGRHGVRETARRMTEIVVPALADLCTVDVRDDDGGPRRLAVRLDDPDAATLEPRLAAAGPLGRTTAGAERTIVLDLDDDAALHRAGVDGDLLRRVGARSSIVAPLRSHGRVVGSLGLITTAGSGRMLGEDDVPFVEALADRLALALDNAGLSSDLAQAERQLGVAFGGLAAAVLIQRPGEGIVYANQAAAAAMAMASPEAVMAATPAEIAEGWDTEHEDGRPLRPEEYPSARVLAGEDDPGPLVVRTVHKATGAEHWRVVKASPVRDADGRLIMAVSVTEDITELKRAELAQRVLADAGEILASSLDYQRTLQDFARLVVPGLADWCSVGIPDEQGRIAQVAVAHVDPGKVEFARAYQARYAQRVTDEAGAAQVLRTGEPMLVPEIPDEMLRDAVQDEEQLALLREIGMRSALQVPIVGPAGVRPIGVLTMVTAESGRVFTPADQTLAQELARRAGTAIANARLHTERSTIAATLQRSLLPEALPDVPGFALASTYRPAGEENWVGGDFYDAFAVEGGWVVFIGDVAGRGAAAAALTAQARHTLRAICEATGDPAAALVHLNRLLLGRRELSLVTVCAVALTELDDHRDACASVICAGHPLPRLVRDGRVSAVGRTGTLLGAVETDLTPVEVRMGAGDVLVLYTDGVLDARRGDERFDDARLDRALAGCRTAAGAVAAVEQALDAFQIGEQADDTALLVVGRCGS